LREGVGAGWDYAFSALDLFFLHGGWAVFSVEFEVEAWGWQLAFDQEW
jgi:hypothetical protein